MREPSHQPQGAEPTGPAVPLYHPQRAPEGAGWTFLTNHAHVALLLVHNAKLRIRDVAVEVGITERAVQRILAELESAGYLSRERHGRRNSYRVMTDMPLRHPIEGHRTLADLVALAGRGTVAGER